MANSGTPVLKGQHNLAQGIALGLKTDKRVVRDKMVTNERFPFRTKEIICISRQKNAVLFRPKEGYCLEKMFSLTGSCCINRTQGGALAIIYWPFRPQKK
jgi:hypothetical protein